MKRILFLTDFSDHSIETLNYALVFAHRQDAHLVAFSTEDDIGGNQEDRLMAFMDHHTPAVYQNIPIEYLVKKELNKATLITTIQSEKPTLIVMLFYPLTAGKGFFDALTLAIIRQAPCPVLLHPESAIFKGVKNIVFGEDYTRTSFKRMEFVREIGVNLNAKIHCLHTIEEETTKVNVWNNMHQLEGLFRGKNISFDAVKGSIQYELSDFAESKQADIIAIGTRKGGFFDRLSTDEETRQLALKMNLPFLIVKN